MADNLFDLIDEPIAVHAGRETLQSLREHIFNWKIWPDFSVLPDESQPLLRWSELAMEEKIDLGGERTITPFRSEEHTSELQSLMRISYAVFCLKNKKKST